MKKYQKIADTLAAEYAESEPHTRLPSDRELAARFGVAERMREWLSSVA